MITYAFIVYAEMDSSDARDFGKWTRELAVKLLAKDIGDCMVLPVSVLDIDDEYRVRLLQQKIEEV